MEVLMVQTWREEDRGKKLPVDHWIHPVDMRSLDLAFVDVGYELLPDHTSLLLLHLCAHVNTKNICAAFFVMQSQFS